MPRAIAVFARAGAAYAALSGFIKSAAAEHPGTTFTLVSLEGAELAADTEAALSELALAHPDREIRYRAGVRLAPSMEKVAVRSSPLTGMPLRRGGLFVLAGGLGRLGPMIARFLVDRLDAKLLVLGRSDLSSRSGRWAEIKTLGAPALYEATPLTSPTLAETIARAETALDAKLAGVFQLASVAERTEEHLARIDDHTVLAESDDTMARMFDARVFGTQALFELVRDRDGVPLITFSSVSGWLGGASMSAYAATNSFLDAFAEEHPSVVHNVAWPLWQDRSAEELQRSVTGAAGISVIGEEEALASLELTLRRRLSNTAIGLEPRVYAQNELRVYIVSRDKTITDRIAALEVEDNFGTPVELRAIALEELPRRDDDTLDRERIAALDPDEETATPAAANELEPALLEIWSEELRQPRLRAGDDLFKAGADSLLIMRVAGRAGRAGIDISSSQLFDNPTVAAQAKVAKRSGDVAPVAWKKSGDPRLLPNQLRFLEDPQLVDPDYNAFPINLLAITGEVPANVLERALHAVIAHHDALSLRFEKIGGAWTQKLGEPQTPSVESHDLSKLDEDEQNNTLWMIASKLNGSLSLASGLVIKAARIDLGPRGLRLLLPIHRLVADFHSWRIIADDLERACLALLAGKTPDLGAKTASLEDWAAHCASLAGDRALDADLQYWRRLSGRTVSGIPFDHDRGPAEARTMKSWFFELSDEDMHAISAAQREAKADPRDLILAAIGRAVASFSGANEVWAELLGHGRDALGAGLDVSRTAGTFASSFPICVEVGGDPQRLLERVRRSLADLPHAGSTLGVLRWYHPDPKIRSELALVPRPAIALDYLGHADWAPNALFAAAEEKSGALWSRRFRMPYEISIFARHAGRLRIEIMYSVTHFRAETITTFSERMIAALRELLGGVSL
jgi:non-ribosomal peptide synthase protein (TIGR01720 family)